MNFSIISLGISVLGLLIWARSALWSARSVKNLYYDRVERGGFAVTEVFIAYPEMRPYFFEGREFPDPVPAGLEKDYQRALAIAHHILMFFDSIEDQRERLRRVIDKEDFKAYLLNMFRQSPILRASVRHQVSKNAEALRRVCTQAMAPQSAS